MHFCGGPGIWQPPVGHKQALHWGWFLIIKLFSSGLAVRVVNCNKMIFPAKECAFAVMHVTYMFLVHLPPFIESD